MNDFGAFGVKESGNTNSSPNLFLKQNLFFRKNGFYPLLPLPQNFWDGSFEKSRLTFPPTNTEVIYIPQVDPITSEYGREYMLTRFTIEFFNFVNTKFFPVGFSNPSEKLGYASNVYRIFYGLPPVSILFIQQVEDDIRQTLSYYLDSPINLTFLAASLIDKKPFVEKISKIEYTRKNQKLKISTAEAESFIRNANEKIDAHLKKYFSEANLSELQKNKTENSNESYYYTVDQGIVLADEAIKYLNLIGEQYFKKTGKKFNVNSGTRTPYRQAEAMFIVIQSGDSNLSLYNRDRVNPILDAYKTSKAAGKSREEIIQAMTAVIQDQVNNKIYISNHLKAGAIDIDINGEGEIAPMSSTEKKIMIEIAIKVTGGQAFEEKSPPHIHIQYQ